MASSAGPANSPLLHGSYAGAATVYRLDGVLGTPMEHRNALINELLPTQVGSTSRRPLEQVIDVALEGGARCAVVEERYIDPDYRSEYSAFWSRRFEDRLAVARRVHFFGDLLQPGTLHELPPEIDYRGYAVLRPTLLGPVGRTVLAPPPSLAGATLATVRERPSLFGTALPLRGAAFCQQDGEFLVCAHTAAWLCHYTAQARGIIGRRPTADFASLPSVEGSRYRAVPSTGLTGEQLQGIFSTVGTLALLYDVKDLPDLPAPLPRTGGPAWRGGRLSAAAYQRAERRERILRVVCRYLNSGCPVTVLTSGIENHAFTLIGWQAREGKVRLIACDDQVGPYEIIEDPLTEAEDHRDEWRSLMIPLPEKVFLTGERAEVTARGIVLLAVARQADRGLSEASELIELATGLSQLKGPVSLRTRLMEGRHYKAGVGHQTSRSAEARRLIRMAHLPHWIWVVELQDRAARGREDDPVLAEVVFDSTSHDALPSPLLLSTRTVSTDLRVDRANVPRDVYIADGSGQRWASLITGPLADRDHRW